MPRKDGLLTMIAQIRRNEGRQEGTSDGYLGI